MPEQHDPNTHIAVRLEDAIAYLIDERGSGAFYACIFNALERVYVPGFGTFAVMVRGNTYVMFIDPIAANKMSFEELVATLEHEVVHLVLQHTPRAERMRALLNTPEDKFIFELARNIAMDAAVNELVRKNHPKIADPQKPLGYWVIAEQQEPPLPPDASFDNYLALMTTQIKEHVANPAHLYGLALRILQSQIRALETAEAFGNAVAIEGAPADLPAAAPSN